MSQAASQPITIQSSPEFEAAPILNRRSLLGGGVAAAIMISRAAASGTAIEADPAFNLIDAARAAVQCQGDARQMVTAIETSLPECALDVARVEIGTARDRQGRSTPLYAHAHSEIVDPPTPKVEWVPPAARAEFREYNRKTRKALHIELQNAIDRREKILRETGLKDAWCVRDLADEAVTNAIDALAAATPITIKGALAVVEFFRENEGDEFCDINPGFVTVAVLERTLKALSA